MYIVVIHIITIMRRIVYEKKIIVKIHIIASLNSQNAVPYKSCFDYRKSFFNISGLYLINLRNVHWFSRLWLNQ